MRLRRVRLTAEKGFSVAVWHDGRWVPLVPAARLLGLSDALGDAGRDIVAFLAGGPDLRRGIAPLLEVTIVGLVTVGGLFGLGGFGNMIDDGLTRDFPTPIVAGVAGSRPFQLPVRLPSSCRRRSLRCRAPRMRPCPRRRCRSR